MITRVVVIAALAVAGAIHLLPLYGVLGPAQLQRLYGLEFASTDLQILMRHRAVLFGILGAFCFAAIFVRRMQGPVLVAALVSVVAFLALAWSVGGANAQLARVARVDLVALVFVVAGLLALVRRDALSP